MSKHIKRCIIILGMHRSGTSAVSGALSHFGVNFGNNLYEPDSDNSRGYYENRAITGFQNLALLEAGYSWSDPIGEQTIGTEFGSSLVQENLTNIFNSEFVDMELCGFKDPRTSYFIEAWLKIFESLNIEPYFIICFRSPHSVISSLQHRNEISPLHAELLWLLEYVRVIPKVINNKHIVVNYDDFIREPIREIKKINSILGLDIKYDDAALAQVDSFVDKKLNHGEGNTEIRDCTKKVWRFLCDKSKESLSTITENEGDVISSCFNDIGKYHDWNLMMLHPETIRRWNAYLFLQGVYELDKQVQYVSTSISWLPHGWTTVRFTFENYKVNQLILSLLENVGEFSISDLYLYSDSEGTNVLSSYNSHELSALVDIWEEGCVFREEDYLHIFQYGPSCKVKFNLPRKVLKHVRAFDIHLRVESLSLSNRVTRVCKFFKKFENFFKLSLLRWKFALRISNLLNTFKIIK